MILNQIKPHQKQPLPKILFYFQSKSKSVLKLRVTSSNKFLLLLECHSKLFRNQMFKGLASKLFKTQEPKFVILLKEWKYHQLVLLHFDGMIIKKRQKDRLEVSINCKGENTVLGIPPSLQPTDDCQTEVIMSYELKDNTKAFFLHRRSKCRQRKGCLHQSK